MPTTARLVGAVLLAALGALAAYLVKPYLPDGTPAVYLLPVSAGMGAILGWVFTGRHLDRGKGNGIAVGLGSAALLTFWVFLLFSGQEMIDRSMRLSYGGPTEALQDVFNIAIDFAKDVMKTDVVATLVIGGVIVGVVTGWVGRRFR